MSGSFSSPLSSPAANDVMSSITARRFFDSPFVVVSGSLPSLTRIVGDATAGRRCVFARVARRSSSRAPRARASDARGVQARMVMVGARAIVRRARVHARAVWCSYQYGVSFVSWVAVENLERVFKRCGEVNERNETRGV